MIDILEDIVIDKTANSPALMKHTDKCHTIISFRLQNIFTTRIFCGLLNGSPMTWNYENPFIFISATPLKNKLLWPCKHYPCVRLFTNELCYTGAYGSLYWLETAPCQGSAINLQMQKKKWFTELCCKGCTDYYFLTLKAYTATQVTGINNVLWFCESVKCTVAGNSKAKK